jgi:hypothetical protein
MPPDTGTMRARSAGVLMTVFRFDLLPLYGAPVMSSRNIQFGLAIVLCCTVVGQANAQQAPEPPVKPTGPAAKKADDLIRTYTARIENEIVHAQKELDRLRGELHELIDVRDDMAKAIADVRADLAAKGTYGADPAVAVAQPPYGNPGPALGFSSNPFQPSQAIRSHRDFVYGLGTALPKNPSPQEREQLRRLAPRVDLKRMVERLRAEVEDTRAEVDELAYKLLELRAGIATSPPGMGGNTTGIWFGSMGTLGGMM